METLVNGLGSEQERGDDIIQNKICLFEIHAVTKNVKNNVNMSLKHKKLKGFLNNLIFIMNFNIFYF